MTTVQSPVQSFWNHLSYVLAYGALALSVGLLVAGAVLFARTFQSLVTVLALSLLLSYLLFIPVNQTERLLVKIARLCRSSWGEQPVRLPFFQPRFVAVVIIFGTFGLLLLLSLTNLLPLLVHQGSDFIENLPEYGRSIQLQLKTWLPKWPWLAPLLNVNPAAPIPALPTLDSPFNPPSPAAQTLDDKWLSAIGGYFVSILGETFHQVFHWVALVMLSFYCLLDGRRVLTGTVAWLPQAWQATTRQLSREFHEVMLSFVKGQVLLGMLTGIYMGIVYSIFGIRYALLLAMWFATAELIPVVGTWLGLTPGLIFAFATTDALTAVYIWLCSYVYQSIKDNILQPKIAGDLMGLHPLAVVLALLLGAEIAGLLGIIMALPLAAMINRLVPHLIHWLEEPPMLQPIDPAHPSHHPEILLP